MKNMDGSRSNGNDFELLAKGRRYNASMMQVSFFYCNVEKRVNAA